jgi:DNA repair protein RecO (recombination protein O)
MRIHQQPAYVLHHRDYSETSLLLEVFTAHHGRIGLIAKGARRASSRMRGILKPFQRLLIGWSGKGELRTHRRRAGWP